MSGWNAVFWAVFVALSAFVIAGNIVRVVYMDVIFGLLVIGVGAAKLGEEIKSRRIAKNNDAISESINYLTRQMEGSANQDQQVRDSYDSRFFKIDSRMAEMSGKAEARYNDIAKKVLSLENRLNEHSKFMLEIAKRQQPNDALRAMAMPATPLKFELPRISPKTSIKGRKSRRQKRNPSTVINISAGKAVVKKGKVRVRKPLNKRKPKKGTKNISINIR